ncbi:dynein regulatory complex subunit 7 [Cephus cinctus]|uniref:Dynein regulatory complex subunit 7 n=1 Tax=Cephus cinctus TaxID=211228 RepID=A0AAJ7R7W9_CEPCN|nr:dynein regulatory complex subunit 7 [Cephus cinctus]
MDNGASDEGFEEVEYVPEDESPKQVILTRLAISQEMLKRVERELGLIRLCWPTEDIILDSVVEEELPVSYKENNNKERLLLWYAENFRKQYHTIYRDRKPLLMVCENESGIQV